MELTTNLDGLEAILGCVDRALDEFGKNFRRLTYWRFSCIYHQSRSEILANPRIFKACLEGTFGNGAKILEREIVSEIGLYCNLSLTDQFDIVQAIELAKSQVLLA